MPNIIKIPYSEAKNFLDEGDVLLFRTKGFISALIKISAEGKYSHVALVSKHNGDWETIEFREWKGGRTIDLENYVKLSKDKKTEIDVYRANPIFENLKFDVLERKIIYNKLKFNGKKVTNCLRKLTGLPYSYKRIWLLLRMKLFRWHILWDIEKITDDMPTNDIIMPVCSTVISHCFSINNFDILNNRSDEYTEPSDIALSTHLNYLFTFD